MAYTKEQMKEDDDLPQGILKRTVVVNDTTNIATVKFLHKRGYSWFDTQLGITIGGCLFEVRDQSGELVMEAHPKRCMHHDR